LGSFYTAIVRHPLEVDGRRIAPAAHATQESVPVRIAAAAPARVDRERIQIVINRWRQNDDELGAAFVKSEGGEVLILLPNDYR